MVMIICMAKYYGRGKHFFSLKHVASYPMTLGQSWCTVFGVLEEQHKECPDLARTINIHLKTTASRCVHCRDIITLT